MSVGILGEYLGRVFDEVRRRPGFIVDKVLTGGTEQRSARVDAGSGRA